MAKFFAVQLRYGPFDSQNSRSWTGHGSDLADTPLNPGGPSYGGRALTRLELILKAPQERLTAITKPTGEPPACRGEAAPVDSENGTADDLLPADQVLELLQQELNRMQRALRLTLQEKLQTLVGRSLDSLEHNRAMATAIQTMLDQHGFRVRCHQCGHPAILRVSPRKGIPTGAFVFDHTIAGRRTFHGGTASVPPIHLLTKPPRRSRQNVLAD